MAAKISELLSKSSIKLDVENTERVKGIREVAEQLASLKGVQDFEQFFQEILARERIESTCMGNEVAFPHARTETVNDIVLAAGRNSKGIWFENCNQNVKLIFVIGAPKKMVTDYLGVVGSLARILKEENVRESLLAATTPEEFLAVLAEAEDSL